MASTFDRWEKDQFFSAAEEVQESADRMESNYRTWIHAMKDPTCGWNLDELRRDLQTTLGTTKWQLEEFGRAVRLSYNDTTLANDAENRHKDFIIAIESQIKRIESSLNESAISQGKPPLPWVRLDKGERDELASFLSGTPLSSSTSRSSCHLVDLDRVTRKVEKPPGGPGHRRTASANADIGSWNIVVADNVSQNDSSSVKLLDPPPRKVPNFSGLLDTMESSISQLKWSKSGYKKLKLADRPQEADTILPRSEKLTKGIDQKNKCCLDGRDDYYDKRFYGWYGTIQRQLQRSQYHIQYSRHVHVIFSIILLVSMLALLAIHVN